MSEKIRSGRKVESLVQRRRSQLSDSFITDYDFVDPDTGCKMKEEKVQGPQGTTNTIERNRTNLLQDAPSRTTKVDLLVMEAELVDDGKELPNPHIPCNTGILETAKDAIDRKGLTPAWEQ